MTPPLSTATWLEDLTWSEFEELAPRVPYWILVAGSTEQHGPHLPLGADTLVVQRLAELSSARHGAVVLGSIRTGVLHAFQDWPGSQRVPADVLVGQATAMARTAVPHSNRLLILNGHDENHEPMLLAARELAERHGTDVVVVEWAQLVSDVIREVSDSTSESHAGEGLTSVFLHWYPERVRTGLIAPGTLPAGDLTRDDLHVSKRAHHVVRFRREDVPSGVLGDPTAADAKKGRAVTDALVERVDALVRERGWL
ncbi:creatininase family protein [Kitasatospora sp. NPDC093550]|uniref:creatininase family protein n=1 Tax=Kitasatospora sp. NPDC093550 TaxID=3364089 RepID=UPI00380344C3